MLCPNVSLSRAVTHAAKRAILLPQASRRTELEHVAVIKNEGYFKIKLAVTTTLDSSNLNSSTRGFETIVRRTYT
ncbi:hypothetical protein CCHR01_05200 [Colletotrichum chrysophilum]|uniref:Uncharacterized protein n=1 Tax=Colletotrichum chrysophilum TaxID=1836956 RepID=A0AAD9APP9_9PEZI|nr:hypothetical protein CCHR01_05200 [Colletotrichum chrysophilum]